ncbi:nucleotidyltransferase domain-containing protein [Candidatus Micrarchaeota archaeon]|nr:nucleotidyltransferase domain-containing protein [Candidatus Micrarchaeota archaeon]
MRISNEPIAKQVFGSVLKRRILHFLFQDQEPISERELSRVLGVSHTAVNKAMKQLLDLNIVKGKTVGTAMVWELNKKSFAYPHVKAFLTASEISPLDWLKEMIKSNISFYNILTKLAREKGQITKEDPAIIVDAYLIGSVAEGTARPDSDVDVLLIVEEGQNKDIVRNLARSQGLKLLESCGNELSVHVYTQNDVDKNKPSWLRESIKKGIRCYSD